MTSTTATRFPAMAARAFFLALCSALFCAHTTVAAPASAPTPASSSAPNPQPESLAKDIWLIPGGILPNRRPDGNTVVWRGTTGLVVLDTGRHGWQRTAILALAKAEKLPIVAIVNSHWHLDHISGNVNLKAAYPGAKVYASDALDDALANYLSKGAERARAFIKRTDVSAEAIEDARGDLATVENGNAFKPDIVISNSAVLTLAGRKLNVNFARNGTTDGDVWLYDAQSRFAAVGDIVTLPAPFLDTACVGGWKRAMQDVWDTPFETLVPGHGKPMSRAQFAQYRKAFDALMVCSNSDAPVAQCAAGWAKDAGPLLEANGMDAKDAGDFAGQYVEHILRPNGGNSARCKDKS